MAGKPATISDLFAPMQSIEACMSSQGSAINSNLVSINHAILNCATTLSDGSKLLKNTTKDLKKTIDGSLKSLNDAAQKQATAGVSAGAGMTAAVSSSIGSGFAGTNEIIMGVSQQLVEITKYVKDIEVRVRGKFSLSDKLRDKFKDKKTDKAAEKAAKKIKAPDVSGGKGAGELAKALAEAAKIIDGVGLVKSKLIKKKAENILGGILDVFEEYKKELTPANMKKYEASVKELENISKEINAITKTMAKTIGIAPFAILGAKFSKIVISSTLDAISPLSENKSLSKTVIAADNLKKISKSILEFSAAMALNTILAAPAMIGTALAGVIIREALFAIKPLGKTAITKNTLAAAKNLDTIGVSILKFTAAMALNTILAAPAMIGTALAGVIIREALFVIRPLGKIKATKNTLTAAANLATIGVSILKFTAAMALTSILAIPAAIGVGMSFLLIKGSTLLFKNIGNQRNSLKIKNAAISIELMCMSMIGFTLTLLATTMITKYLLTGKDDNIDPTNVIALGGAVVTFGLMLGALAIYKRLGKAKNVKNVLLGGASVAMMSASFILFSLSLLVSYMVTKTIIGNAMSDGKFDVTDIASIVTIAPMFMLMFGAYKLYKKFGEPENAKKVLNGGLSVVMMAVGFMAFALSFYVVHQISKSIIGDWKGGKDIGALIMDVGIMALMIGSFYLYNKIGAPEKTQKVLNGGLAVLMMSIGFIAFSGSLWIANQFIKDMWKTENGKLDWVDLFKTVAIFGLMYGSMLIFKSIGNNATTVLKGAATSLAMSVGIAAFGFGLSFLMEPIQKSSAGELMMAPVLFGLFAVEFAVMGNFATNIALGAAASLALSIGIGAFGLAIGFYVDSIKGTSWKEVGMMAALVGIFGAEFALLGIPVVAGCVALGAVAITAVSGALYVFGKSLGEFIEPIKSMNPKLLIDMVKVIGALGLEFALLGAPLVAPFMATGAGAMTIVASSVLVLSKAMKEWTEVKITDEQLTMLCVSIDRIKLAFQGNPEGDKSGGFFSKLGKSISGAVLAPFDLGIMTTTAAGLSLAGLAIKSLSSGIKDWLELGLKDDSQMLLLCDSVAKIKLAFQGNPDGEKSGGLLSKIGSVLSAPFDHAIIAQNAQALVIASNGIKNLSKGIEEWVNAGFDTDEVDKIITVIVKLRDVFGQMGARKGDGKSSLLKKIIGVDFGSFEMSDVEVGARSVQRMGKALIKISKGLIEFHDGIGSKFKTPKFMEDFALSVANVVSGLSDVFAVIGSDDNTITKQTKKASIYLGRMFQDMTINTWNSTTKNKVSEGIKAVKDLGSTIKDIALGLKEFKEIVPAGNTSYIVQVAAGLTALLDGLTGPLIAFGTTEESFSTAAMQASSASAKYGLALSSVQEISAQTTNFEHHKVDVANAMKNIGQIGELVKGLAEGAKVMADPKLTKDIGKAGTITGDFIVGDDGTGVVGNIQKLVCSNLAVFLQLGKKIEEVGVYEAFHDEIVQDTRRGGKKVTNKTVRVSEGKKSYIAMAVDAAVGIGQVIMNLAEGYKQMNDVFPTNKQMTEGTARVTKSISAILTAFSTIGLAMDFDSNTIHQLIPAAFGDPEMSKMFGNVSGLSPLLKKNSGESFNEISENIKTIVDTVLNGISGISGSMENIEDFYKKSNIVMESGINLTVLGMMFANHADEYKLTAYHNGKDKTYTLSKLYKSWLENAKENVGLIKDTSKILSEAVPNLSKLTPAAGNSFVNFSTQMSKGMNTLSGTSTNIVHATNFVEKLRTAVKEDVFGNISSNTQKIASAINSIDNEIFEPYAKMIGALGTMTDKHSEFVKMQKELYELLEKIIDKINEANTPAPQTTGGETTTTGSTNSQNTQKSQQSQQTKQQNLTARLTPTKVTLDTGTFISDFENMLKRVKSNN